MRNCDDVTHTHTHTLKADQELAVARRSWLSSALAHVQLVDMQMQNRRVFISDKMCEAMKDDLEFAENIHRLFESRLRDAHHTQSGWTVEEQKAKQPREAQQLKAMREAEARARGIYAKSHGQKASNAQARTDHYY